MKVISTIHVPVYWNFLP